MNEFQLESPFKPTGDQPAAIERLVEGVQAGQKGQVLLGATGTGKSLGYDDPVFVVEERNGQRKQRVIPIGQLIDSLFAQPGSLVQQEDTTELLNVEGGPVQYYAQAFDHLDCSVSLRPIRSFIRHRAPTKMFRLRTACGRTASLTGDHNLWVLRAGKLALVKTEEVAATDYVPLPDVMMAQGDRETLDTLTVLSGRRLFVEAPSSILSFVAANGPTQLAKAFARQGISEPYSKLWSIRHNTHGRGIKVETFQHALGTTHSLGGYWDPDETTVGSKLARNRLPARLKLTPTFMRLVGYYIAEGHHQARYIVIANRNDAVREDIQRGLIELGLSYSVRNSSDFQISSAALAGLFSSLGGEKAQSKHLPAFWPELSNALLGQLLRAYFDGDGTIGQASDVTAITASPALASDLLYALLRLGIWGRLSEKWKRATNSQHPGDRYFQITISGHENLQRFQDQIGFSIDYKARALEIQLQHSPNSNVDIVPIRGDRLRWLRLQLGLAAETLGNSCGLSRTAILSWETGQRFPSRIHLQNALAALKEEALRSQGYTSAWEDSWQELHSLCLLRWTPVKSIEPIAYQRPHVYDLCVPGAETFLAGVGGFFVHNTFTIANIIAQTQRPALIMSHNKTLAAQIYAEFKDFFPRNAVEYFVSYYDYYQPEAYVPRHDLYIEKETEINEEIERLRLAATTALLSRKDVIIVASVSCIYGLGSPEAYGKVVIKLKVGETIRRNTLLRRLVEIHYTRNDTELKLGTFRVRGDTLEIMPAYEEIVHRIELFGDDIERIMDIQPMTGEILAQRETLDIFPARHFITNEEKLKLAIGDIEKELEEQIAFFKSHEKYLEAQRIEQRTRYDLEMLKEVGYCSGIENYSRHMDQRAAGSPPWTLIDYFPANYLMVLDESHMTVPQVRGMYGGDRSRKTMLAEYGFRLPSALDNRPLSFSEFEQRMGQTIYMSATPGPYELERTPKEWVVQQIIRPTGLVDPQIEIRSTKGQVDDLVKEIKLRLEVGERTLVTTLTKKMSENLADYLLELGVKVHYLHSEVETLERIEILRDLRLGVYDVVVGINLLREGLDLPEVSLVAILDADKEGFLRSHTSLLQTVGRAARHLHGRVIMYADKITDSMRNTIDETNRRRTIQEDYNKKHGIVPASIIKSVRDLTERIRVNAVAEEPAEYRAIPPAQLPRADLTKMIKELEKQMKESAQALEFEKAAMLRDQILELREALADKSDAPAWERAKHLTEEL